MESPSNLAGRWIRLSLFVGAATLAVKLVAYWVSGSAAILGDVAESVVHIAAVTFSLFSAALAAKPADESHPYGHAKIVFFAAGLEGMLVMAAALVTVANAVWALWSGAELGQWQLGLALSLGAGGANGLWGLWLRQKGKRADNYLLAAHGEHLMADGWTSLGAAVGLVLAGLTEWRAWDAIAACLVGLHVLWSGLRLVQGSVGGLMDRAEPELHNRLCRLLDAEGTRLEFSWHRLRHRPLGESYWVDVHLLFDDEMPLREAHRRATELERALRRELGPGTELSTHLEPQEDHALQHPPKP
ncbi:MAG: cation diffusion facilitator family transporter [Verrucomicrobiota bacterium JB022]|nr:cation diffusion facilitator family transporter [Verrucomicrobiota bacterium JB022]